MFFTVGCWTQWVGTYLGISKLLQINLINVLPSWRKMSDLESHSVGLSSFPVAGYFSPEQSVTPDAAYRCQVTTEVITNTNMACRVLWLLLTHLQPA